MSEQQVAEPEVEQATEEVEAPKAPQDNPLYKTLFEIADGDTGSAQDETEPDAGLPVSISEAVNDLHRAPTEETPEEPEEEIVQEPEAHDPEKSKPKKKKLRKVVDPDIPEDVIKQPAFNFSQDDEVEDREFLDNLIPEEREVYDLAKYASKSMGEEYQGYDNKFKSFFTKSKEYLDKRLSENPHMDLQTDDDYQTFIEKNRPKFTSIDAKKIEREMVLEQAEERARKKLEPEIARLRKEQEIAQIAPKINEAKTRFRQMARDAVIPEEYQKTLESEEGIKNLAESNPLEYQLLENATASLLAYSDTFTDIVMGATQYDESDKTHTSLMNWVKQEQDQFIQSGQTEQDGKIFMRRERYYQIPEDKRSEYYTWTDNDLLKLLMIRSKDNLGHAIAQQRETLTKSGYVRQQEPGQVQQPQPQQPPQPEPKAPSIGPSPRPANVPGQAKPSRPNSALLTTLGL